MGAAGQSWHELMPTAFNNQGIMHSKQKKVLKPFTVPTSTFSREFMQQTRSLWCCTSTTKPF